MSPARFNPCATWFSAALILGGALAAACAPEPDDKKPPPFSGGGGGIQPPTGVAAQPGHWQVTLSWEVAESTSYNVYWSTAPGVDPATSDRWGNVTPPFTQGNLDNGAAYYYVVTAVAGGSESAPSAEVSAVPVPPAPDQVTIAAGDGQVTLAWSAVSGADSYNLYWSEEPGLDQATANLAASVSSPYTVAGLTNDADYYFVVTAVDGAGEGPGSPERGAVPSKPAPPAPDGVSASPGNGAITVTWNQVAEATSYNIYYSGSAGVTRASGNRLTNKTSPFIDSPVANGVPRYYVVTALNGAKESTESIEVSATPQVSVAGAPTGVAASPGNGQVTISWNAVGGATGYNLYWRTSAGVTKTNGNKVAGVSSPYPHTGLTNGTTYYYVVTALDGGESAESVEANATPQAPSSAAPTGLAASPGDTHITLTWSPVSGATSYNLYWSTATGVTKVSGTKIAGVSSPYAHTGLTNGTAYYYVVTALNLGGESAESGEVSQTPVAWVTKTPLSRGRYGFAAAEVNGIIYAIGGASNDLNTVEAYNPLSDAWSARAAMPTGRCCHGAAAVNGIIYAIGGIGGSRLNTVEAYDPVSNSWSTKTPMPTARNEPAVVEVGGIIYAIGGGGDAAGSVFNVVEAYNPISNTWSTKTPMPTARYSAGAAVVNGIVYVFGGASPTGASMNVVEAYDPAGNSWSTKASMPIAKQGTGVAVIAGIIYAIGGWNGLASVEAYNPISNSWVTSASLPTGRGNLAAAVVNTAVMYAIGGANSGSELATVEAYTPPP